MQIYILIAGFCLLLSFLETIANRSPAYRGLNWFCYVSIALLFFIIAGFRLCGFDYENYHEIYLTIRDTTFDIEPGYALLNRLAPNYEFVIATMSLLILWIQFRFIWRYSYLPILTIFFYLGLYMYPSTMGQFRQFMAVGIVIWAYMSRERRWRFFLLIALGMLFHYSAILGVAVLWVPTKLGKLRFYVLLFFLALLISITAQTAYMAFIKQLPEYVSSKLATYASLETTALGLNTAVLIRAFLFFSCYYYKDKLLELPHAGLMINIYFLSLFMYTALGFAPQVAVRGSIYFSFFELILSTNLIYTLRGLERGIFWVIFVGFSIYRQLTFFSSWTEDYIPYNNWLFNLFS